MTGTRSTYFNSLLLLILLHLFFGAQGQTSIFELDKWSTKLSSKEQDGYTSTVQLLQLVKLQDSIIIFSTVSQLESKMADANPYFRARFYCFLAWAKFQYNDYQNLSEINALSEKAVSEANITNDKRFIAFINWHCGSVMINSQQLGVAVMYKLRAEEIYSTLGYPDYNYIKNWSVIGELLFHSREYEQSIFYTKKALHDWHEKSSASDYLRVRYYNTIAQDYEQLNKLDSALIYLDTSLMIAEKGNYVEWIGINFGFKGEVYFKMNEYKKAKPFLEYDYMVNRAVNADIAAKSLQWIARINIMEGKTDSALMKSKEAVELVQKTKFRYYLQPSRYLELCYSAVAESFKAAGKSDSFYVYNRLYARLHDSIQNVSVQSSSKIAQMKIDNENILRAVQLLQEEKRNEVIKRNLVIIAIALLSLTVFLYVKHIKLKQRHREEMVLREKQMTETELESAKQQMLQFTENIIEKSDLIEKLNQRLSNESIIENQHIIDELSSYTILTEADWENFKRMFEKIYPRFFTLLKEKAPNITVAEQRMAALTRLNLNSKQMASMLGISVDSVHKTKQRLRQRLQVQNEANLEETLAYL